MTVHRKTIHGLFWLATLAAFVAMSRAEESPAITSLTLPHAIELGIKNNIDIRLAQAKTEESRGRALKDAAALLPQITGTASQSRVFKVNFEASGFPSGGAAGFDPLIGPFNTFDARVSLAQSLLDLSAIEKSKAGRRQIDVAKRQEDLAREQVASATALTYLDLVHSRRSVEAAQADTDLAQSLLDLSQDQRRAGLATGVDVARAQTRLAENHLRLIRARTTERQSSIRLARIAGLPLDQMIVPTDALTVSTASAPTGTSALEEAEKNRPEMAIAAAFVQAGHDSMEAARYARVPTVQARGDYGLSGNTLNNSHQTGSIGAYFSVPVFSGRRIEGDVKESEAELHEAQLRADDTRAQVEEDVRLSFYLLADQQDAVATATQALALAEKEMQMARDRYSDGVGDNIQITSAQSALAQAHEDQIAALADYNAARLNFDMALGHARTFTLQ